MNKQQLDFSVNVLRALLWQYNAAENLQGILQAKQDWYDENQTAFWSDWITNVFDLRTANDFGLTVWSILLGVPLSITLAPDYLDKRVFGYGQYHKNFASSNYGNKTQTEVVLTQAQKRIVIQLRYYQLVSRGTVPQTNKFLASVFSDFGPAYVLDGLNMEIDYTFGFSLPAQLQFVLTHYDILPRPAGVGVSYRVITRDTFGYGPFHKNYTRGNFGA